MIMYKLLKTQHNYSEKLISVIVDWEITEKIKRSQVVYETRYLKRILQSLHQEKRKMKDNFSNKIWIIWVSNYVIQTNKHINNISRTNQSCVVQSSEQVCYHILKWHTDILQEQKKSQKTCQKSFKKTLRKEFLSQIRKMQIS